MWDQGSKGWDRGSKGWDRGSKGWDLGPQHWDQESQTMGSGSAVSYRDQESQTMGSGSGVSYRDQGPGFTTFVGSGMKIGHAFGIKEQKFAYKNGISDEKTYLVTTLLLTLASPGPY